MADRPVVIVSNRGPVSFRPGADGPEPRRGAGGLVSGIGPLVAGTGAIWVAAAMTEADREVATGGVTDAAGFRVRLLDVDAEEYRLAYDVVCNSTLWFVHHGLFDLPREPVFDRAWWAAWEAYRRVNATFAEATAEVAPPGAVVLVQDYHLALVGPVLARLRPDLATVHFSHTPFASPAELRVLPPEVRTELLVGLVGHDAQGFHTARWAEHFSACCEEALGVRPAPFAAPLAPDPADIRAVAGSPACADALARLDGVLAGRSLLARVDRIELSKNLLRGFAAFDDLLDHHPEHRGRVVFGAWCYPSREGVENYARYRAEVDAAVGAINDRWGTPGWQPVVWEDTDDFPASVAALRRADVLLVNPVRDGLNLVAKECCLVNERDAALVLSTEAGAWDELGGVALGIHPFDVRATSDALHQALTMGPGARTAHAAALRELAAARTPQDWLRAQLTAAG